MLNMGFFKTLSKVQGFEVTNEFLISSRFDVSRCDCNKVTDVTVLRDRIQTRHIGPPRLNIELCKHKN